MRLKESQTLKGLKPFEMLRLFSFFHFTTHDENTWTSTRSQRECWFHCPKCKKIKLNVWETSKKHSQSLKEASPLHHTDLWLKPCVLNLWALLSRTFRLRSDGIFTQSYLSDNVIVPVENKEIISEKWLKNPSELSDLAVNEITFKPAGQRTRGHEKRRQKNNL